MGPDEGTGSWSLMKEIRFISSRMQLCGPKTESPPTRHFTGVSFSFDSLSIITVPSVKRGCHSWLTTGVLSETRKAPQRPAGPPWTPGAGGGPSRPRTFNRTRSCSTFESDRAQSWIIFPRGEKSLTTHRMTQIPRERKCLKCHLKSKNPPSPESQAVS